MRTQRWTGATRSSRRAGGRGRLHASPAPAAAGQRPRPLQVERPPPVRGQPTRRSPRSTCRRPSSGPARRSSILVDTSGQHGPAVRRPAAASSGPRPDRPRGPGADHRADRPSGRRPTPTARCRLGILTFSSSVAVVLPMADFDEATARAALASIPPPNGGTAIGRRWRRASRPSTDPGCIRKYLICITDGENTVGPAAGPGRPAAPRPDQGRGRDPLRRLRHVGAALRLPEGGQRPRRRGRPTASSCRRS